MRNCMRYGVIPRGSTRLCSTDEGFPYLRRSREGRPMFAISHDDETCRANQPLLDKWRGGMVQLWEYTISHFTLALRLTFNGRPGNLHLECSGCLSISGPVSWLNSDLRLHCRPDETGETVYVVCDAK